MNKIIINGTSYDVKGRNINVRNNRVFVDNQLVVEGMSGTLKIEFEGDLASLDCTSAVVNGNVHGNIDSATITVNGDVAGDLDGTSIKCGNVGGDVDSTSVTCGKVKGDIDAMTVKKIVKK